MNRQEYEDNLNELVKIIDKTDVITKDIENVMEKLYAYKPVSLRWHTLKCKILNKTQKYEEATEVYSEMICKESRAKNNIELWKEYINSLSMCGKGNQALREKYIISKLFDDEVYKDYEYEFVEKKKEFIAGNESLELIMGLEKMMNICCQRWMAFLLFLYREKVYPETKNDDELMKYCSYENVAYLYECMQKSVVAIIISDEKEQENYDIVSYLLYKLGIKVFFIGQPVLVEGEYDLNDSVVISIDNSIECEDCIYIPSVINDANGELENTNIPYIIDYICKKETQNDFAFTFASNNMLEKIRRHHSISKRFERLSRYEASYIENEVGFAWSGNYYTYISDLYRHDVREWVNRKPECMFSIVVPVRNATETLYHTLKTCIEQEYDGTFEVVLSDNSEEDNEVAFETYKKINNKNIKYYRTPRQLSLAKSYEYAYLQTRGKYILSIGADDAVLPWALNILENVWEKNGNKEKNIIRWDRGFYAWPGFNGGQENELIIPYNYKKNQIEAHINSGKQYFMELLDNPGIMYLLPNLYINSGFKREYMLELYNRTGRLWDGYSQDIYVGIQNLMLNENILYIVYPITIAGMSSSSVGTICTKRSNDTSLECKKIAESLSGGTGICCMIGSKSANMIPDVGSDISAVYMHIYHLITKGIIGCDYVKDMDVKKMFVNCYKSLSLHSDKYEKYIYYGEYLASLQSEEIHEWFNENIFLNLNKDLQFFSKELQQELHKQKKYNEGFDSNGGVILDASRFGVTNIYEARDLFVKFLNF